MSCRIEIERSKKDLSKSGLANILNVSKHTVCTWEIGSEIPSSLELSEMAKVFDCSVDYILGKADNRKGFIQEYDLEGHHYEFELDRDVLPNGLTEEKIINYIRILENRKEVD